MSTIEKPTAQKVVRPKQKKEPGWIRIRVRRAETKLTEPAHGFVIESRRRHAEGKALRRLKWRRRTTKSWALEVVTYVVAFVLALWVARAIGVFVTGRSWGFPIDFDHRCSNASIGVSCGALSGLVMTVFTLAVASAIFLFWRLRHVRGPYVKRARDKAGARALVPTAGKIVDDVVGRSALCRVIMDDLRDPDRRPHLIVGGVGSGKTAVLLKLTRVLAENRAVPVPIRLRDAQGSSLNFETMARKRFLEETNSSQMSDAEGGKVWRRLIADKQIVVLADGLEEALIDNPERDSLIRLAIDDAHRAGLALVIASRPHAAITGLDVATVDLEALSEEAAIEYICDVGQTFDERRIDWLVETAEVTETPLYLQLARELHRYGLLERTEFGQGDEHLDTRGVDRAELRLRLMHTWTQAMITGYLRPELPFSTSVRARTVDYLGALACVGLKQDTLEVKFDDLIPPMDVATKRQAAIEKLAEVVADELKSSGSHLVLAEVNKPVRPDTRIASPPLTNGDHQIVRATNEPHPTLLDAIIPDGELRDSQVELRLAAARGERLGLVEMHGDRVRFPHSILQAYLGSRLLGSLVGNGSPKTDSEEIPDVGWLDDTLKNAGREALIGLVLHSRASLKPETRQQLDGADHRQRYSRSWTSVRKRLVTAANRRDEKSLDVLAAALEIDSVDAAPAHSEIAATMLKRWPDVAGEERSIEDAKRNAVARLGEAAKKIAERRAQGEDALGEPAYDQLFLIAAFEQSYPVRLAIAQSIGDGGDSAFDALEKLPVPTGEKLDDVLRHGSDQSDGTEQLARDFRTLSRRDSGDGESEDEDTCHNVCIMLAWLAPLLFGSTRFRRGAAKANLERWLRLVREREPGIPLSLEIALAQGFKHAANRRPQQPHTRDDTSDKLEEYAVTMLKHSRFWFSRLTLIHALCLWAISDTIAAEADSSHGTADYGRASRNAPRTVQSVAAPPSKRRPRRGDVASAEALADHWLTLCGEGAQHPFLLATRDLVVSALATRTVDRFIWIDEDGVIGKVGSRPVDVTVQRKHSRWIPPSAGWSALNPDAQQLVADVLLMLNLAERGNKPQEREDRLGRANRNDLPPCVREKRDPLDPHRTVGMVGSSAPGSSCASGCHFELCPYPPKGEPSYRAELSEAFCRRQKALLTGRGPRRRTAPWQGALSQELKRFWEAMEERARS